MSDDLAALERIAGSVIASLSSPERRRLLRKLARDLRGSQSARIAAQRNADGSAYEARRKRQAPRPGGYAVKFLYPKGDPRPRLVLMKGWYRDGDKLTGYDIKAGAIRSFLWDKVAEWLPVDPEDRNKGGGKGRLRRRGHIRRAAMFRKLRNGRNLKSGATDRELWVGFSGRAAAIARVHQEGGEDRPAPKARPVRYPRRELIGLTAAERTHMLDGLLAHVAASL